MGRRQVVARPQPVIGDGCDGGPVGWLRLAAVEPGRQRRAPGEHHVVPL